MRLSTSWALGKCCGAKCNWDKPISFAAGDLHNAGHYLVLVVGGSSTENGAFDVTAAPQPSTLSFLAKPSRVPVDLRDGISGVVYVFDTFQNLILQPTQASFQLSGVAGAPQARTMLTRNGVAWTKMNSASKEGAAQFVARVGSASDTRVITQVPGDPVQSKNECSPVRPEPCARNRPGARLQRQCRAGRNNCYVHRNLQRRRSNCGCPYQTWDRAHGNAGL